MILTIGKKEQGTDIVEEDMSAGGATCSGLVGRSLARWLARCESLSRAGRRPRASESQQIFEINKVDSSQRPHELADFLRKRKMKVQRPAKRPVKVNLKRTVLAPVGGVPEPTPLDG
jgi:hypothetical protein